MCLVLLVVSVKLVGIWQGVEEKRKNKKKDRTKRKGKKGDDKEVEEEAEGPADDPKQDEASKASDHASPPGAEQAAAEGTGVNAAQQSGVSTPSSTAKDGKPSSAKPVKNENKTKGVETSGVGAPSQLVAGKGTPQKESPKCPAKQDRARKGAARQADAHAAGTASGKAAEEEADASEWQNVGAAQRKARRGHKALNPQPAAAPHQAAVPSTTAPHHYKAQRQPPPPPLRGPPTAVGGTKPAAAAAPARAPAPAASQEPRPSRQQSRAAEARAVASVPAAQARGNGPAPSFADVARPVQDWPAKATKQDAPASSSLGGSAWAGSPLTQRAARTNGPLHFGAAPTQPPPPEVPQSTDIWHPAADAITPASQQPPSAAPQQQLPVPLNTASSVAPSGTPATCQPLPVPAALPAVTQPPAAPGSTLSALAKTWQPAAMSVVPIGPPGAVAERRGQSREAAAALQDDYGTGMRREGCASAAPINAAPAVWRSSLGAHSVDWSFPRTSSGTSLSSLVPPRLPVSSCPCLPYTGLASLRDASQLRSSIIPQWTSWGCCDEGPTF